MKLILQYQVNTWDMIFPPFTRLCYLDWDDGGKDNNFLNLFPFCFSFPSVPARLLFDTFLRGFGDIALLFVAIALIVTPKGVLGDTILSWLVVHVIGGGEGVPSFLCSWSRGSIPMIIVHILR